MNIERAREINSAMLNAALYKDGLVAVCPDLSRYSLLEMVQAGPMVRADDDPSQPGRYTMVCDDRLVAALYTLCHFQAEVPSVDGIEPIVVDQAKALVCVRRRQPEPNEDDG